ncbi:response regulator [Paractinoplanes abujensis]|uniref:CheY-like chemotaxis protein n=1 Tax=Paractinoplanes abujensis TaxID=882441 RepID=A0A7W7CNE4_9ACTN|nr:response regulator [Actinoplanes abujensis]MBB4691769.1 CheY-like chemotaxis protein [Actinoplanes abujensis]GID16808.1 response regulator [Actinoplanes abujensis]
MSDLVLVVEDSDEDIEAIDRAIGRSHPDVRLEFLRSGSGVLPRLTGAAERPRIVLLDLNMPGEGGLDVIRQVRARGEFDGLRLVVFTSSENQAEAEACYAAGADSYIYKPINFALFRGVLSQTLDYWRSREPNVTQTVVPPPGDSPAQA